MCTVVALRSLPVFVVQAVLGGAIALTALGARWVYGSSLRRIDRCAIAGCVLGLGLIAGSAGPDHPAGLSLEALLGLFGAAGLLVVALVALRSSGRAWPLGVVAGLGFGGTSVAVRAVHRSGDTDPLACSRSRRCTWCWRLGGRDGRLLPGARADQRGRADRGAAGD